LVQAPEAGLPAPDLVLYLDISAEVMVSKHMCMLS
jgi:hypothetical protein